MGILAVVLGLLAVVCALLAPLLFGTAGGVVAGVLAVAAIVLGILKRKKDGKGGIPAIVIGVLSVILAFSLTSYWSAVFKEARDKAMKLKPDGLWAQISEDTNSGMFGIIKRLPADEASMNALMDELNELNKLAAQ